jgi:hypothetical protein
MKHIFARLDRLFDTWVFVWIRAHRPLVFGLAVALVLTFGGVRTLWAADTCGEALLHDLAMNESTYDRCMYELGDGYTAAIICGALMRSLNDATWASYYICALQQQ